MHLVSLSFSTSSVLCGDYRRGRSSCAGSKLVQIRCSLVRFPSVNLPFPPPCGSWCFAVMWSVPEGANTPHTTLRAFCFVVILAAFFRSPILARLRHMWDEQWRSLFLSCAQAALQANGTAVLFFVPLLLKQFYSEVAPLHHAYFSDAFLPLLLRHPLALARSNMCLLLARAQPFEDATRSLRVGEISSVVETDSGVHIILRTG